MRIDRTLRPIALAALAALAACTKTETKTVTVSPPDSTYLVEWLPGTTGSVVGKSTFQLRVRKRADSSPATGLAIRLAPVMHMPTKDHSTPADVVVESSTPGTYDGALYYLMASGAGAGYWQIDVSLTDGSHTEVHTAYPSVDAARGTDTVRANLLGPADAATSSKYFLFRDGPYTGTNVLSLHLSHGEQSMMTFKAVEPGASLDAGAVTTVVMLAATDPGFATAVRATGGANGHYALDLSRFSLAPEVATTVYVRLSVNGEDKTTNGLAPGGGNAAAQFSLTPATVHPPASAMYVVEYVPTTAPASVGKSTFQLRVRTASGGMPASGLPIAITPVMHMPTMVHGAPAATVIETATPGTYDATIYYLMASSPTMGYWELRIDVGGEVHLVYPSVRMAMGGDTVRANLYDVGANTGMTADRYYLFRDGSVTVAQRTFGLHLSRAQNMLMTFPVVETGAVLANGVVSSLTFTASADAAFTAPIAGAYQGDGHWTFDLSSMSFEPTVATTVYVKLAVNGAATTTNGNAPTDANAYATFSVTPE